MTRRGTNPIHYSGDLRRDLIEEALKVIGHSGTAAVSLRALTRSLGVSHAAPKNHFPTKEALFAEIAREGFILFANRLSEAGERAEAGGADAHGVLEAQGLAYLEFAEEHRSHFALMFRTDLFDTTYIVDESTTAFAVLQRSVRAAQDAGWRQGADGEQLAGFLWATVHGQAHLEAQGLSPGPNQDTRAAIIRFALADQT